MVDAPAAPARTLIPLHPDRADWRATARVRAALRALRIPPELAALLRANGRGTLQFLAPALLLALGAALLALLAASVATALGVRVGAGGVALTAGRWTLLAATGGALARRGLTLARARWR